MSGLWYSLRQAFQSVTRSGLLGLASVATVAVSLLVLAVILLFALNLEFMASTVESQVEVKVYLKTELNPAEARAVAEKVRAVSGVQSATFVSREEALRRMREAFAEQKDILDGLEEINPLRDSIEIKVTDPNETRVVADRLQAVDGVSEVDYGRDTVEKLLSFTRAVRIAGLGLVVLLVLATIATISNTIRLAVFARQREISIMKLVGATDWFIRRPFLFEGILLGGLGAALSMLVTAYGYRWLVESTHENLPFLPIIAPDQILRDLTLGLLLLGCGLGAAGSLISIRRFLRV